MKKVTMKAKKEREEIATERSEPSKWTESPYRKPEVESRGQLQPKLLGSPPPPP